MAGALGEAVEAFAAECPHAAADPEVAEAAVAAAREAAERRGAGERVTYLRVSRADFRFRDALGSVRALTTRLSEVSALDRWWWLEKHDEAGAHLRLRLHGPAILRPEELHELGGHRLDALPYEPEMALFGGPVGLGIAHRFHHLDSELLSRLHLSEGAGDEAPLGVTVRVVEALFHGAGLDPFERWDVWMHFARSRPIPPDDEGDAGNARWFDGVRAAAREELAGDGPFARYVDLGAELATTHRRGELERGLRQVIVGLIVFHCNRARLGYVAQARLGLAGAAAYEPMPEERRTGR